MIKYLTLNELKGIILSTRSYCLYLVLIILTIFNTIFTIDNYNKTKNINNSHITNYENKVDKATKSVSAFAESKFVLYNSNLNSDYRFITSSDEIYPNCIEINIFRILGINFMKNENIISKDNNIIDWVFIVGVVLSFFALVLTFDSINGDKIKRVLALNFSNSIKRSDFLIGKFISRFLIIFIPFCIFIISEIAILSYFTIIAITWKSIVVYSIFLLISGLYLSIFLLLGIWFSIIFESPQTSIISLFIIWFICIILIPSFSKISILYYLKNDNKEILNNKIYEKEIEIDKLTNTLKVRTLENFVEIEKKLTESKKELYKEYVHKKLYKMEILLKTLRISPYKLFQFSIDNISYSGYYRFKDFYLNVENYQNVLYNFVKSYDKDDIKSRHLFCENSFFQYVSRKEIKKSLLPNLTNSKTTINMKVFYGDIFLMVLLNLTLFIFTWRGFYKSSVI